MHFYVGFSDSQSTLDITYIQELHRATVGCAAILETKTVAVGTAYIQYCAVDGWGN